MAKTKYSLHTDWHKHLKKHEGIDLKRINTAIVTFGDNSNHPSLNLEKASNTQDEWWTIRASDSIRIALLKVAGIGWVFVRSGGHDEIYNFINHSRVVYNANTETINIVSIENVGKPVITEPEKKDKSREPVKKSIFQGWDEKSLVEVGIPKEYVVFLLACTNEDDLFFLDANHEVPEEVVSLAIDLLGRTPRDFASKGPLTTEEKDKALVNWAENSGFSKFFDSFEDFQSLMSGEIERWMVWPNPRQKEIINANYAGPAQVRGPAGTGKTVIALHRVAKIVEKLKNQQLSLTGSAENNKIAFITFNKNLSTVLGNLYGRIPGARRGDVDFRTLDSLVYKVVSDANLRFGRYEINPIGNNAPSDKEIKRLFSESFEEVIFPEIQVFSRRKDFDAHSLEEYLYDEVESVIDGRGIEEESEYLEVPRLGRKYPFGQNQRKLVWKLYTHLCDGLEEDRKVTFSQRRKLALKELESNGTPIYRSVFVDEVQDLSLVGLKIICQTLGASLDNLADGLLIVGDEAQRVYKNSWSLKEAGINVVGRSTILEKNYRNTQEILDFALAVAGEDEVIGLDEIDGIEKRSNAIGAAELEGGRSPKLIICKDEADQAEQISLEIRELIDSYEVSYGEIVILFRNNKSIYHWRDLLGRLGIPTADLADYDGTQQNGVQLGTLFKAKGLESKIVILPDMTKGKFLPSDREPDEEENSYQERIELETNRFWVAATRARDFLLMTAVGEASDFLSRGEEFLEVNYP